MYAYGSGLAASFYAIRVRGDTSAMRKALDLSNRLEAMDVRPCEEYVEALNHREHVHNIKDWEPKGPVEAIAKGTYYLVKCDKLVRIIEVANPIDARSTAARTSSKPDHPHRHLVRLSLCNFVGLSGKKRVHFDSEGLNDGGE